VPDLERAPVEISVTSDRRAREPDPIMGPAGVIEPPASGSAFVRLGNGRKTLGARDVGGMAVAV
jgi:hypothetical protein